MTTLTPFDLGVPEAAAPDGPAEPAGTGRTLRRFLHHRAGMIGLGFLVFVALVAIFAPLIAPHDPNQQDLLNALEKPSSSFWLGTDQFGRDQLSRLIYGARVSLLVGLGSMTVAVILGVPLGLLAGFVGRAIPPRAGGRPYVKER